MYSIIIQAMFPTNNIFSFEQLGFKVVLEGPDPVLWPITMIHFKIYFLSMASVFKHSLIAICDLRYHDGTSELHGPPMSVDKTNFYLVLFNHANFYRFEEASSYWSVKRISVFLCFSLVNQQHTSGVTVYNCTVTDIENSVGPCIAAIAG